MQKLERDQFTTSVEQGSWKDTDRYITDGIDDELRKEQAGFRSGRGTTEQIFILRNIIEQVNKWQATLYINLFDVEKKHSTPYKEKVYGTS